MQNLQELKDYLNSKNLFNLYTWSNPNTHFKLFTTAEGIDLQVGYKRANLPLDAKMWIDYKPELDEFVLEAGYFTHDGEVVSKEEFINQTPASYPIVRYNEQSALRWIRSGENYVYQVPESPVIQLTFSVISKRFIPTPTLTPISLFIPTPIHV